MSEDLNAGRATATALSSTAEQRDSSTAAKPIQDCRFCGHPLSVTFVDLGMSPLCEEWLSAEQLNQMEPFYPLHAYVCERCFLVQLNAYVSGEQIFGGQYAYFSSYSDSWLAHSQRYVQMITRRLGLGATSQVIEVASNDGYLLQYFVAQGVPVLGIEPAENCAAAARDKGVETIARFFGVETARMLRDEGRQADLLIANNVLAHVPDLNDFVAGIKLVLKPDGIATLEFPHLMNLVQQNQFDTIYQEHYCYFSLLSVEQVFARHQLTLFDVEPLETHGGSLRIFVRHADQQVGHVRSTVAELRQREIDAGYAGLEIYRGFQEQVLRTKYKLLEFLIAARRQGKRVVGCGAPGKAVTLLNYCGIREDLIEFTVDRNPFKHGRFMAGVRIPVHPTERLEQARPDYVLILPWNLQEEITQQLAGIRQWGGKFVVPIPEVVVLD